MTAVASRAYWMADAEPKVYFGGRLGEYRYYDMDAVLARALELLFEDNPAALSAIDASWATLGKVSKGLQPFIEANIRLGLGE